MTELLERPLDDQEPDHVGVESEAGKPWTEAQWRARVEELRSEHRQIPVREREEIIEQGFRFYGEAWKKANYVEKLLQRFHGEEAKQEKFDQLQGQYKTDDQIRKEWHDALVEVILLTGGSPSKQHFTVNNLVELNSGAELVVRGAPESIKKLLVKTVIELSNKERVELQEYVSALENYSEGELERWVKELARLRIQKEVGIIN